MTAAGHTAPMVDHLDKIKEHPVQAPNTSTTQDAACSICMGDLDNAENHPDDQCSSANDQSSQRDSIFHVSHMEDGGRVILVMHR
jgi:hypothetical protein